MENMNSFDEYVISKEVDGRLMSMGFKKEELVTRFVDSKVYSKLDLGKSCLTREEVLDNDDILRVFISDSQIYCEIEGSWGGFYSLGCDLTIMWQEEKSVVYILNSLKSSLEDLEHHTDTDLVPIFFRDLEESFVFEELSNHYGKVWIVKSLNGTFLKLGDENAGDHFVTIGRDTYDLLKRDLFQLQEDQKKARGW